jgi:arginyl-tRNA synthetase
MNDEILNEASGTSKRKKIEKTIYDVFNILDKTGENAKKYQELFSKMSDEKFNSYMKKFLNSDENFYLEVLPNLNEPSLEQIKEAADYLGIPLDEYVYYRNDGNKENPIRSSYPVPVGWLNIKRMRVKCSLRNLISKFIIFNFNFSY